METTPTSRDFVYLREAARRLGRDHRTVKNMIEHGTLRGGAEPHPQRLRWYVYTDQLPADTNTATPAPPAGPQAGAATSVLPSEIVAQLADKDAEIVTLKHNNRLLTAAVGDLLEAFDNYKAGAQSALASATHFERSADGFSSTIAHYRDVIAQMNTPSTAADLFAPTDES
ncbi:MAG: hypothetical protein WCE30_05360 [Mycobacterium sp.]